MKAIVLTTALCGFMTLSACGDAPILEASGPEAVKAKAERLEAKTSNSLDGKDIGELIDYVGDEASDMTDLLKGVTDGATAEAAVKDIRAAIPRINAAFESLDSQDVEELSMSATMAMVKKMPNMLKTQGAMMREIQRISEIPEARTVLEKEFDDLELFK